MLTTSRLGTFGLALLMSISLCSFQNFHASAQVLDEDGSITLSGPFQDDLYTAGASVSLDYPVAGDALLAGAFIDILAPVSEDLNVAGSYITIHETVGDDLRAAGGYISIDADVGDDLIVTGGIITLSKEATVQGNVYISGGIVNLRGKVLGDVHMTGGILDVTGSLSGNLSADAGQVILSGPLAGNARIVTDELKFGTKGIIEGNLVYWLPDGESQMPVKGSSTFDKTLRKSVAEEIESEIQAVSDAESSPLFDWSLSLYWLLSRGLIVLMLIVFVPKFLEGAAKSSSEHPFSTFLTGFISLIAAPIGCVILMMTLIGFPLGISLFFSYLFLLLFLQPIAAVLLAHLISSRQDWELSKDKMVALVLACLLLIAVVTGLPYLGSLASFFLMCFSAGALLQSIHQKWSE